MVCRAGRWRKDGGVVTHCDSLETEFACYWPAVEVQTQSEQRLLMPVVHFSDPSLFSSFFIFFPSVSFFILLFLCRDGKH